MRVFMFLQIALVALVTVDQTALDGRYSHAVLTQSGNKGAQINRDVRRFISANVLGY